MKYLITILILASAALINADQDANPAAVNDLILQGRLVEAQELLAFTSARNMESPEHSFIQGLTTLSGESSIAYLKDYINRVGDNNSMHDWARLNLGKYYLARNIYETAMQQFGGIPEESPFYDEAHCLIAKCYRLTGEYENAIMEYSGIIDNHSGSAYYYWANLGLADSYFESGNYGEAERLYQNLLQPEMDNDIYPLAILGMAESAKALNRKKDANEYLDLYKSRYGSEPVIAAINPVVSQEPVIPDKPVPENKPDNHKRPNPNDSEKNYKSEDSPKPPRADGRYYIQVGSFAKKDNAVNLAELYKRSGYDVYMETIAQDGRDYYRLIVGGYTSRQQAEFIQKRLEKATGEKYLILLR